MTERIERIVMVILAIAVVIFGFYINYASDKIKSDRVTILEYQSQIEKLEIESERQARLYDESRRRANFEMQQVQDGTRKLLAEKVPKDCNKAMEWGRHAASNFR